MKKILYTLLSALLALTACQKMELAAPSPASGAADTGKVAITFPVTLPTDALSTKAMADQPQVKNIYVAVFGGSGYFNEWVPAEVTGTQMATQNETVYNLRVKLSMSESRLRLHVIANSPVSEPPITGISSQDTEDIIMSKIRSQIGSENNDGYWQKILLPFGIQAVTEITNGVEQYKLDEHGNRIPTALTISQFTRHSPIPLVRDFARVQLVISDLLTDVQIDKFCLAYAPEEGPIAPILPNTYTSDEWGAPITVADGDNTTTFWNESFFINYQNHPLTSEDESVVKVGDAPFNYKGYSPADLKLGTYPASLDDMTPWSESTYLYVYERAKPRPGQKATRVIIHAKKGSEAWKYYPLDIVGEDGESAALLRNFTYTLTLTGIAPGSGEDSIEKAADATAANVSADVRTQDLNEVSDGEASIATEYIDKTYIAAGTYSVMFRFVPHLTGTNAGVQHNEKVSLKFGYNDGVNGFVEGANSANGNAFASDPTIEMNGSAPKLYVRSGNGWAEATTAQINNNAVEKWSKINYTTVGTAGAAFTQSYTKTIRVIGTKDNGTIIYRDVQINLIPRKKMIVECLDKYIEEEIGTSETVRVYIPDDLTRSMFPIQFKLESAANSLTPRDGDNLPVQSGKSIVPGRTTQPGYFFVKTLSRDEYAGLSTTTIEGVTYKYFDCKFKSTVAASATTVYVDNEYFVPDSDDFANYTKRLFSGLLFSGHAASGEDVNFTFTMDAEHNGARVWNTASTISATNKVIPTVVTVTLTGLQPKTNTDGSLVDAPNLVKGTGTGVYYYNVKGTDTPSEVTPTLHLTATADDYSIQLSTDQISPNPQLYENASRTKADPVPEVTGLSVSPATASVRVGGTTTLTANVTGTYTDGLSMTWTSSNPDIATVNANGVVTGVAVGTATITVSCGGKTATSTVSVVNEVTETISTTGYDVAETGRVSISSADGIVISFSSVSNRYTDCIRISDNTTITISSNNNRTIKKIVITYADVKDNSMSSNPSGYTDASDRLSGTWTGDSKTITFSNGNNGRNYTYIAQIEVTYQP